MKYLVIVNEKDRWLDMSATAAKIVSASQGSPPAEIACVLPSARQQAADDIARKYPNVFSDSRAY